MELYEIRREIQKANNTLNNADQIASSIADILEGRLRHVSPYILKRLKKKNFVISMLTLELGTNESRLPR